MNVCACVNNRSLPWLSDRRTRLLLWMLKSTDGRKLYLSARLEPGRDWWGGRQGTLLKIYLRLPRSSDAGNSSFHWTIFVKTASCSELSAHTECFHCHFVTVRVELQGLSNYWVTNYQKSNCIHFPIFVSRKFILRLRYWAYRLLFSEKTRQLFPMKKII